MKNRKKEIEWNKDTKKMKRRDQIVISRLQTGNAQGIKHCDCFI
jgi:hypothetical protein